MRIKDQTTYTTHVSEAARARQAAPNNTRLTAKKYRQQDRQLERIVSEQREADYIARLLAKARR